MCLYIDLGEKFKHCTNDKCQCTNPIIKTSIDSPPNIPVTLERDCGFIILIFAVRAYICIPALARCFERKKLARFPKSRQEILRSELVSVYAHAGLMMAVTKLIQKWYHMKCATEESSIQRLLQMAA